MTGYLVVGLDYFEGDYMQKHPDRSKIDYPAWVKEKQAKAAVLIPPWVETVRKSYGEHACKPGRQHLV